MWTIFRTSAAAAAAALATLSLRGSRTTIQSFVVVQVVVLLLIGDATRNRKPSCNDRSQTPDHAAAARAGRKTLEKVFVLILHFLARKGDLVRVQNACKCEKRTSDPNFGRGGSLHSFSRVAR